MLTSKQLHRLQKCVAKYSGKGSLHLHIAATLPKTFQKVKNNVKGRISYQNWYDLINGPPKGCLHCGKPTKFISYSKGYGIMCGKGKTACPESLKALLERKNITLMSKYGNNNPSLIERFVKKRQKTFINKYGVDNPFKSDKIQKKVKRIFKIKYDGHPMNSKKVRDKVRATNIKRYGSPSAMQSSAVKAKIIATCLEKYGVPNVSMVKEIAAKMSVTNSALFNGPEAPAIFAKMAKTCMKRYGVKHAVQNASIFNKIMEASYRIKNMTVDGVNYAYMGFEDVAIKHYLSHGFKVEPGTVYPIAYKHEGKYKIYFPDFLVTSPKGRQNIIEVKTNYTLGNKSKTVLKKNIAKIKEALSYGNFTLFVVDNNRNSFTRYKNNKALAYAKSFI